MEEEPLADFISYYRDNIDDGKHYRDFWKLNRDFTAEDAKLASKHGMHTQDHKLTPGKEFSNKTYDATNDRQTNREDFISKADKIARQHGFTGKSYNEHTKEQETKKGQTKDGKPDGDKEPPPHSPSGGGKAATKEPSKEERRQAFMQQMRDAGGGLTKGKERER